MKGPSCPPAPAASSVRGGKVLRLGVITTTDIKAGNVNMFPSKRFITDDSKGKGRSLSELLDPHDLFGGCIFTKFRASF